MLRKDFFCFVLSVFGISKWRGGVDIALAIEPAPRERVDTHIVVSVEEIVSKQRLRFRVMCLEQVSW